MHCRGNAARLFRFAAQGSHLWLQLADELGACQALFGTELFDLWRLDFVGGLLKAFLAVAVEFNQAV